MMMANDMMVFTAHAKAEMPELAPVFVRDAFNWFAFLFTGLWAIYHRLWWLLAVIMAAHAITAWEVVSGTIGSETSLLLQLGLQIWVGYAGPDFLRAKLRRDGYAEEVVISDSKVRAQQRYFERHHELLQHS